MIEDREFIKIADDYAEVIGQDNFLYNGMPHKFSDRIKAMRQQLDLTMMRIMDLRQQFGVHF